MNILRFVVIFIMCLLAAGCSSEKGSSQSSGARFWKGAITNGDKPGIGLVLKEINGQIVDGTFYLLDPDKPHDFKSAGQTVPFENIQKMDSSIRFTIRLLEGNTRSLHTYVLSFANTLNRKTVGANLYEPGDTEGMQLILHTTNSSSISN